MVLADVGTIAKLPVGTCVSEAPHSVDRQLNLGSGCREGVLHPPKVPAKRRWDGEDTCADQKEQRQPFDCHLDDCH